MTFSAKHLGQAGLRLQRGQVVIYVDPYLTDRVADVFGREMQRMHAPPLTPEQANDACWVLITHAHADHCDPATLVPMARASTQCRFLGPAEVRGLLTDWGIESSRICVAGEHWVELGPDVRVHPVPAAHSKLERWPDGSSRFVGYVIEIDGKRVYHAGDTMPHEEVFAVLDRLSPINVALLPVNERNYFRDRAGIVGNMSIREAFQMASRIGVEAVVPIHWDLFGPNSVYWEEIELLYRLMAPTFQLASSLGDT
ncbi:MAG TPA: MBL fold metallo-hydrolase [Gemmatimonadaceae bacterium]|jgi:L-ascorbate metabolism protein UlaG (beta-lactamase superfamily)